MLQIISTSIVQVKGDRLGGSGGPKAGRLRVAKGTSTLLDGKKVYLAGETSVHIDFHPFVDPSGCDDTQESCREAGKPQKFDEVSLSDEVINFLADLLPWS